MRIYLEDDVIFYKYKTAIETTYWLEVELFEHAENNIDMLYDFVDRKWYDENVVERTIHCLIEARPKKDWSVLKSKMLQKINGGVR
jgi:hypothetical protein